MYKSITRYIIIVIMRSIVSGISYLKSNWMSGALIICIKLSECTGIYLIIAKIVCAHPFIVQSSTYI